MKPDARVRIDVSECREARLVATDPDDDCTITDAIDIGRDGSVRRVWLLTELARREGLFIVDKHGKRMGR